MKIALTADIHLTTRQNHPERYNALENILNQINDMEIERLVIAGDLFDKGFQNYSEFEVLCKKHPKAQFHIIPGNHDAGINSRNIVGPNIHIYTKPEVVELDKIPFLFLPYEEGASMGENIATVEEKITPSKWVLVAHGDYCGGVKEQNPLEPGTYMPLAKKDLDRLSPRKVLLGHIHKAMDSGNVCYVGSPCGLDINETGRRRFVVYNTDSGDVEEFKVNTDIIYFNESFVIIPIEDEITKLSHTIKQRIESWELGPDEYDKVCVRIKASGYSLDRSAVQNALKREFDRFRFYKDEEPDITGLSTSDNPQLSSIASKTGELIENLQWNFGNDEPDRDQVLRAALHVIYE